MDEITIYTEEVITDNHRCRNPRNSHGGYKLNILKLEQRDDTVCAVFENNSNTFVTLADVHPTSGKIEEPQKTIIEETSQEVESTTNPPTDDHESMDGIHVASTTEDLMNITSTSEPKLPTVCTSTVTIELDQCSTVESVPQSEKKSKEDTTFCALCNKRFSSVQYFNMHKESHDKAFQCKVCFKVFTSRAYQEKHEVKHTNPVCQYCKTAFKSTQKLWVHRKKCSEKPKYPCAYCENEFSSSQYLEKHEKIHRTDLRCKFCDKTFKTASYLASHEIKHSTCQHCKKTFTDPVNLKSHKKTCQKKHQCNTCEHLFSTPHYLKKHIQKHHPKTYTSKYGAA